MSKSFNYKQSTGDQLASVLGLLGVGSSDATMTSCLPSFCHIAAASSPLKLWDERLRCWAAETGMRSKDKRTGVKIQNNDEYLKKCLGFGQNPQILAAVPQTAERSCNHRRPRRLNSSPTSAQAPSTLNLLKSCSISDTIQYYLRGAQQIHGSYGQTSGANRRNGTLQQ